MTRAKEVHELRVKGLTYQQIADDLGITRQRVHQILKLENDPVWQEVRRIRRRAYYQKKVQNEDA